MDLKTKRVVALRVLCLLCALLVTVAAFAGCGGKEDLPDDTQASDTDPSGNNSGDGNSETEPKTDEWGQTVVTPEVPDNLNFNGETVNIIMRRSKIWTMEWGHDADLSDKLDMAIYSRNSLVEHELNVDIEIEIVDQMAYGTGGREMLEEITKRSYANDGETDLVVASAYALTQAGLQGQWVNFLDDTKMPYMDLAKPYWNQNYIDSATVFGQLNYIVGDINLSLWSRTMLTLVNLNMYDAENYDKSIFDVVTDYEWTYEYMYNVLRDFEYVENGTDTVPGYGDKVGLITFTGSEAFDSWGGGYHVLLMKRDESGETFEYNVAGRQTLADMVERTYNLLHLDNVYLSKSDSEDSFSAGQALFQVSCLMTSYDAFAKIRNMTDRYGILPMPMWNEEQADTVGYTAQVQDTYNLMAVPNWSSVNGEMMSAFLELMCGYSYSSVRPVYVDTMLSGRYLADPDNKPIMDLIFDGVYFEPGVIYSIRLGDVRNTSWREAVRANANPLSAFEAVKTSLELKLSEFNAWYGSN